MTIRQSSTGEQEFLPHWLGANNHPIGKPALLAENKNPVNHSGRHVLMLRACRVRALLTEISQIFSAELLSGEYLRKERTFRPIFFENLLTDNRTLAQP